MYITISNVKNTDNLIKSNLAFVDKLYLLGTFLISFNCIIRKSLLGDYTEWMSCFTYISWVCMIIRLLICKHPVKSLVGYFICFVVATACFCDTGELVVTIFLLRIFAADNMDESNIVKVAFCAYFMGFFVVVTSSLLGEIQLLDKEGNYILGFANINSIGGFIGLFIVTIIYLNYCKLKFHNFIELILINLFLLHWTGNRTTCFAVFAIIFLAMYLKGKSHNRKMIMYLSVGTVIVAFALLMIGILCFKKTLPYLFIDKILTGRLFQGNYYYSKYQISLLGNNIPELFSEGWHLCLDMGYAHLIMLRGVLFSGIFIFILYGSIIQRIKSKDVPSYLLLLYVAIHLLMEPFFCDMNLNIAIIFFGAFLSGKYYRKI